MVEPAACGGQRGRMAMGQRAVPLPALCCPPSASSGLPHPLRGKGLTWYRKRPAADPANQAASAHWAKSARRTAPNRRGRRQGAVVGGRRWQRGGTRARGGRTAAARWRREESEVARGQSVSQSINQSTSQSINQSVSQSINQSLGKTAGRRADSVQTARCRGGTRDRQR